MSTEVIRVMPEMLQNHALDVAQVKGQVQRIQEVMRGVMKKGVHYGVIPGTQKPTLYKAGSELLLSTFRIAVELEIEDLSSPGEFHYRVHVRGRHTPTGLLVGEGIGECSSLEEKYRWRAAVCDEEWAEAPDDMRRTKYGKTSYERRQKGGAQFYTAKQVRTQPADVANTILKMAKKRGQVDLTLTALACSDVFDQDLEDLSPELRPEAAPDAPEAAPERAPERAPQNGEPALAADAAVQPPQLVVIRRMADNAGIGEEALCKRFELEKLEALPFARVNEVLAYIRNPQ